MEKAGNACNNKVEFVNRRTVIKTQIGKVIALESADLDFNEYYLNFKGGGYEEKNRNVLLWKGIVPGAQWKVKNLQ